LNIGKGGGFGRDGYCIFLAIIFFGNAISSGGDFSVNSLADNIGSCIRVGGGIGGNNLADNISILGILSLGVVVGIILGIFLHCTGIILGIDLGIILSIIGIDLGIIIGVDLGHILGIISVIQLVIIIKLTACRRPFS